MSKGLRAWKRHCNYWMRRFGLHDWVIIYKPVDKLLSDDGSVLEYANVTTVHPYRFAVMQVSREALAGVDDVEIRAWTGHEMVHVVLAGLGPPTDAAFDFIPRQRRDAIKKWWSAALEETVTKLTRILVDDTARTPAHAPKPRRNHQLPGTGS